MSATYFYPRYYGHITSPIPDYFPTLVTHENVEIYIKPPHTVGNSTWHPIELSFHFPQTGSDYDKMRNGDMGPYIHNAFQYTSVSSKFSLLISNVKSVVELLMSNDPESKLVRTLLINVKKIPSLVIDEALVLPEGSGFELVPCLSQISGEVSSATLDYFLLKGKNVIRSKNYLYHRKTMKVERCGLRFPNGHEFLTLGPSGEISFTRDCISIETNQCSLIDRLFERFFEYGLIKDFKL